MNIAFDLDGVLYPWHKSVYDYLTRLPNSLTRGKNYHEFWEDPYTEITEKEWSYYASLPILYTNMIPSKPMLDMLRKLDSEGHTLYYITNRIPDLARITEQYLNNYKFPQAENLILSEDKAKEVRILEIDIIVEDKPKNLEQLSSLCRTIGISQPWNQEARPYLESLGVLFLPSVMDLPEIL